MIKTVSKEQHFCDNCGKEQDYIEHCVACGREFCYDCEKTEGTEYHHAVHFQGSGDGFFCNGCLSRMTVVNPSYNLWKAYLVIQSLRNEYAGFRKDFDERAKKAEENLQKLLKKVHK